MICNGVPRFDPDGVFDGYIASCVDLTDIRNAQEEAHERHNLESLGVLAGGIAHDFNNLLGGALAFTELAQTKLVEGTAPLDELRKIGDVAARGSEIVRQLMIYAGNESGTLGPVDVSFGGDRHARTAEGLCFETRRSEDEPGAGSPRRARKLCADPAGRDEPGHQRFGGDRRPRWSD